MKQVNNYKTKEYLILVIQSDVRYPNFVKLNTYLADSIPIRRVPGEEFILPPLKYIRIICKIDNASGFTKSALFLMTERFFMSEVFSKSIKFVQSLLSP